MKNNQYPLTVTRVDDHYVVVTAQGNFFAKTHSSVDAEMIAAAPEMLDALEAVERWAFGEGIELGPTTKKKLHAAIAKARGQEARVAA